MEQVTTVPYNHHGNKKNDQERYFPKKHGGYVNDLQGPVTRVESFAAHK